MAARGGLEGGDGSPVEGTSGIPLGPCDAGSAVVEALQRGIRGIDDVAAGEDFGPAGGVLAIVITTGVIIIVFRGRHFCLRMPALLVILGDWYGKVKVGVSSSVWAVGELRPIENVRGNRIAKLERAECEASQ